MANDGNKSKKTKQFFKDFKAELKKVIWPTPKQIVNSTVAVVTIVLITAVIVLVLDLAFEGLNKYGVDKLKTLVQTNTTENTVLEGTENTVDQTSENVTIEVPEESVENTVVE